MRLSVSGIQRSNCSLTDQCNLLIKINTKPHTKFLSRMLASECWDLCCLFLLFLWVFLCFVLSSLDPNDLMGLTFVYRSSFVFKPHFPLSSARPSFINVPSATHHVLFFKLDHNCLDNRPDSFHLLGWIQFGLSPGTNLDE